MTDLRRRMIEDMQLHGLSPATQGCYAGAVRSLALHYGRSPDQLSEHDIRQYFLYLVRERNASESTIRVHRYGIKFFFEKTLKRDWPVLELIRPAKREKLPVVLGVEEVGRLLGPLG